MFVLFVMQSYLIEVRGLKHTPSGISMIDACVVSYRGTWIETYISFRRVDRAESYLIEVRGLKQRAIHSQCQDGGSRIL